MPKGEGPGSGSPVVGDVKIQRVGAGYEVSGKQTWDISGTPQIMLNHAGVRINVRDTETAQALGLHTYGVGQYVVNETNGINAVGWGTVGTKLLVSVGAVASMAFYGLASLEVWRDTGSLDQANAYLKSTDVDALVSIARGGTGVHSSLSTFSAEVTTSDRGTEVRLMAQVDSWV